MLTTHPRALRISIEESPKQERVFLKTIASYQELTGLSLPGHVVRRLGRENWRTPEEYILAVEFAKSFRTTEHLTRTVLWSVLHDMYRSNKRYSQILKRYRRALRQCGLPEPDVLRPLRYYHLSK